MIVLKDPSHNCNHKKNYNLNNSNDLLYSGNYDTFNHNKYASYNHVNKHNNCDVNCNKLRTHHFSQNYSPSNTNTTISTLDNFDHCLKHQPQHNQLIMKNHIHNHQQKISQKQPFSDQHSIPQPKKLNQNKYIPKLKQPSDQNKKDSEYAHIEDGDVWDGRYVFSNVLGKGSFGQVVFHFFYSNNTMLINFFYILFVFIRHYTF